MSKEFKTKGLSRRDFIKGVAAGAVGVAAAGVLGACSSNNSSASTVAASADSLAADSASAATTAAAEAESSSASVIANTTASANEVAWPSCEPLDTMAKAAGEGEIAFVAETIADSEISSTVNVDVVICGLGPAGLASSIACAEQGLNTVALEKGINGTFRSATMGGLFDRIHEKYNVQFDAKMWLDDAMVNSLYYGKQDIYQRWIDTHAEAVNWFLDHLDASDDEFVLTFAAGDFPDFFDAYDETSLSRSWNSSINLPLAPADIITKLIEKAEAAGAELYFETPAVRLVQDGADIVGVIAKTEDGYVKYNTAKGVVLCTGGYEFNLEKLKRCCRPRDLALSGWMNGTPTNTGDGHEMGLAAGAMEDEYPHPLMLDPAQLMPYLRVNKLGKRFTPEYEPYNHLALAIQNQPGAYDYYITDGDAAAAMDKMWTPSSSCYAPKEAWIAAATSESALKADTIEELAELMGVPSENLEATITHWNEMCEAGEDSDFHFPAGMMHPINTPPYYANLEGAESLCTAGGLQITPDSEVIDESANVIPGLYAIGNVSGSMFHGTYPHNLNSLSHSRCITFGYNVAKLLAAKQ